MEEQDERSESGTAPPAREMRERIRAHGDARREALAQADAELDAVVQLVPSALALGLTKVELAQLGAISRPTLDAKLREQ